MRIVLRPDLGSSAGLGHLSRTTALAEALREACVADLLFVVEAGGVPLVGERGFRAIPAGPPARGDATGLGSVELPRADVFVVDSYEVDQTELESLFERFRVLVVIDDLARAYAPADIVVNGAAHAQRLSYDPTRVGELLLGPSYVLLGSEYRSPLSRTHPVAPDSVLVMTGGGDPLELMPRLLETVREFVGEEPEIDAVIGPYFSEGWSSRSATERWRERGVRLHERPAEPHKLMDAADLAVTGAGLVLYEMATRGVPMVAFSLADNQRPQLQALAEQGALCSAGDARRPGFWSKLRHEIDEVAGSPALRERLASRARRLVDGHGAERVAARILEVA